MAMLKSYDLKGNKQSFANWISNLSPTETPFISMINKEAVDQTTYSWQVDRLSSPINPGFAEGSTFVSESRPATRVMSNFTQILRKGVRITDTANRIGLYGRSSEKAYQMEKAGKEIKRDLEKMVLQNGPGEYGKVVDGGAARKMGGFRSLVAQLNLADVDTGAVVHKTYMKGGGAGDPQFTEGDIFDMSYNLYLAGSKANKIMVHPVHMHIFSDLIGNNTGAGPERLFKGLEDKFNSFVGKIRDPLGQEYTIIPNRFMSQAHVFFFNENDWTQMVLREPKAVELARNGSAEKHMIEMEVGLRHRNPYASGVMVLKPNSATPIKGITARLTHDSVAANVTNKLIVKALEDGVPDGKSTEEVTFTCDAGVVFSPALTANKKAFVAGEIDIDVKHTAPGNYPIKMNLPTDEEVTVELVVHSKRNADGSEELVSEIVAPKASRAKK